MQAVIAIILALALAGCSGNPPSTNDSPSTTSSPSPTPNEEQGSEQVAQADFMTNMAMGSELAFDLGFNATQLVLTVDFGPSAFTGFAFGGIESCEGVGPGTGVFPNSSSWTGACEATAAGRHTLTWSVETGAAQGSVVVQAIP